MTVNVRCATPDDFRAFFHFDPPESFVALLGEREGVVLGMGGIVHNDDGEAVAFFEAKVPEARTRYAKTLHRQARRVLDTMRAVGEPVIYAYCEDTLEAASRWMARLGFERTGCMNENKEIWSWRP